MRHFTNKVLPLCSTCNKFCTNVFRVVHWWHMPIQTLFCWHRYPNHMVTNWISLLISRGLCTLCVVNNWHVVSINQLRSRDWHSHYAYLVLQSPECFHSNLHRNKLRSKNWSFNSCLLLGQPSNWSIVQEDNVSSSGSSGEFISCMVWINKYSQINFLAPWLRCVGRNRLLHVTIKITPIMLLKHWHVRSWICWIKYHPGIVIVIQISKNVGHRFKLALPWYCNLWG